MGYWGYGLFENDSDLDLIGEVADECGLTDIEEAAQEKAKAEHAKAKKDNPKKTTADNGAHDKTLETTAADGTDANVKEKGAADGAEDKDEFDPYVIMYSLFADYCSDKTLVRDYLDSGALNKLIEKHKGYDLVLIGVSAMSLGCTLSEDFLKTLRKQFQRCGLSLRGKGRNQVGKALNGPGGFENGKEYDFRSKGLIETANDSLDGNGAEDEEEMW